MRHRVEMYPFDTAKTIRMRKKRRSELMNDLDSLNVEEGRSMLHATKRGMKIVRARERPRSRFEDQMRREGKVQRCRPRRSPRLKRRTWRALKMRG
jgi:hypothetical protein